MIEDFECKQFIYCSDAGLASENNRLLNHTGKRAFIVTQSIKKLRSEYKTLALNRKGFRRLSDNQLVDIDHLSEKDYDQIFYKEEPYNSGSWNSAFLSLIHQSMLPIRKLSVKSSGTSDDHDKKREL